MKHTLALVAVGWPWVWVILGLVINVLIENWLIVAALNFALVGLAVIEGRGYVGVRAAMRRRTEIQRALHDGIQTAAFLERSRANETRKPTTTVNARLEEANVEAHNT